MIPVEILRGDGPVVLGMPHTGTHVPDDIADGLNDNGRLLADTDWHVDRLYDGLLPRATVVRAMVHRYVIDANRDPSGKSLYPGQNTTGLCPLTDFDNRPIWRDGREPDAAETARRLRDFHTPYHAALAAELDRVRARHGLVVLYDCHSIRSVVPHLFDGTLPDFNIGTKGGTTCAPEIEERVAGICMAAEGYTTVVNGRFTGGWTTRHYGRPEEGAHAIQMELAQSTHLAAERAPFSYDEAKAERLRQSLKAILAALEDWALAHHRTGGPK
jgi:formiminoglutamase